MFSTHQPSFRALLALASGCLLPPLMSLVAPQANAETLSDNLNATTTYTELISGSQWVSASFGTGNSTYTLTGVTLLMQSDSGGTAALDLYSNTDGTPAARLGTLQAPSSFSSTLTPTSFGGDSLKLSADTTYWAVLKPESGTTEWAYTDDNTGMGVGFQHNWAISYDAGSGWYTSDSQPMQMRVDADPASAIPEPGSVRLLLMVGGFAGVGFALRKLARRKPPVKGILHILRRSDACLGFVLLLAAHPASNAQSLGPAIHRTRKPITFATPGPAQMFTTTSVPVRVHISGGLEPAEFKITLNGKKITDRFTASGACSPESCYESASLSIPDGIRAGWNRLSASASNSRGAVDGAQLRFFYRYGLGDSTDSSQPPFDAHIAVQPNGDVELGYQPNVVGGSTTLSAGCPSDTWSVVVIDRASLTQSQQNSSGCFYASDTKDLEYKVSTLPYNTIVVVRGPLNSPIGQVDMSSIGGTNFTIPFPVPPGAQPFLPNFSSYSIIGYGQSAPGLAYESYTTNGDNPPGIEGVLENVCCSNTNTDVSGSFYAFRPADQPGFTVSYPNNLAQIEIKYNTDLPLGPVGTPNRATPSGLDLDTVANPGSTPGIWMAIFYRQTLQLAASQVYTPTAQDPVTAYKQLSSDIDQLYSPNGYSSKDALIFVVITQPQGFPVPPHQGNASVIGNLSRSIQALGGSAADFWQAVSTGKHYSLVGTTTDNVSSSKQYSTEVDSQQFESGLLHGQLTRNHQMLYTPAQLTPITTNFTAVGDDLWERDIASQVGGTRPVPWPYTGDPDHLAAYAWLSRYLVDKVFYGIDPENYSSDPCTESTCDDIRFYYTGSEASQVSGSSLDPTDPSINKAYRKAGGQEALGFSPGDLSDQQTQLSLEKTYLGDAEALNTYLQEVFTSSESNIALTLTTDASNLAAALTAALPEHPAPSPVDKLALTSDILSDVAGAASVFSGGANVLLAPTNPVSGTAAVISGVLSTTASILNTIDAAHPAQPPTDPYVVELADLESASQGVASKTAIDFSTDLQASTATFFTRVYSDWYRLQSVALMSVNTDTDTPNPWYMKDVSGPTASEYLASLTAGAEKQFYMAILPQHFTEDTYPGLADGYNLQDTNSLLQTCYGTSDVPAYSYDNPQPSVYTDYGWLYNGSAFLNSLIDGPWSSAGNDWTRPGRDVYVIRTTPNSQGAWGFWTDMGNTLMAPQNATDGTGPLNLNQNWFFESNVLPKIYLGCPAGGGPNNFAKNGFGN